jgi:ATP-dependent Clp protease ATP-binding subunit ClpC
MSAYAEPHQAVRLIGTPAGPRSVADDGLLTGPLRRAPRAMVLLSEIDRAHPDMIDLLLPLLATGRLTDGQGRIVDGRQAIFVLTTDLEVAGAGRRALGFGSAPVQSAASDRTAAPDQTDLRDTLRATLRATFSSDLLGCIDEIVHFRPLAEADLLELARRQVAALARRLLAQHQIELTISSGALALLARRALAATGGQPDSGYAQTVQRAVTRLLSEPISRELLAGRIQRGARVLAEPHGDTIVFVSQPGSA